MKNSSLKHLYSTEELKILKSLFKKYDTNRSGTLSKAEIFKALKALGSDMNLFGALCLLEEVDADKSGELSFEEFIAWMEKHSAPSGEKSETINEESTGNKENNERELSFWEKYLVTPLEKDEIFVFELPQQSSSTTQHVEHKTTHPLPSESGNSERIVSCEARGEGHPFSPPKSLGRQSPRTRYKICPKSPWKTAQVENSSSVPAVLICSLSAMHSPVSISGPSFFYPPPSSTPSSPAHRFFAHTSSPYYSPFYSPSAPCFRSHVPSSSPSLSSSTPQSAIPVPTIVPATPLYTSRASSTHSNLKKRKQTW